MPYLTTRKYLQAIIALLCALLHFPSQSKLLPFSVNSARVITHSVLKVILRRKYQTSNRIATSSSPCFLPPRASGEPSQRGPTPDLELTWRRSTPSPNCLNFPSSHLSVIRTLFPFCLYNLQYTVHTCRNFRKRACCIGV